MRITLLLFLAALMGCATKHTADVTSSRTPQAGQEAVPVAPAAAHQAAPDPIAALVARLTATDGSWINGTFPIIEVPSTASTQQVLERVFKMTGFDKGNVRTFQIIQRRQVQIPATGHSGAFTAVLVETNLGRKIVLLKKFISVFILVESSL